MPLRFVASIIKHPLLAAKGVTLELFRKADDAVRLLKAGTEVECKALGVAQLTIAGKLPAALLPGTIFAGDNQHFPTSGMPLS